MAKTLFISDLHLSKQRQDIYDNLSYFIDYIAIDADALYILGDLFDFWIGDDEQSPFQQKVIEQFQKLKQRNIPCYFINGNRDILLDQKYAQQAGFILLADPTIIDIYGVPTLLMHGDSLCTLDVSYQKYRRFVHNVWVQRLFLKLPLSVRLKIAHSMRSKSYKNKSSKESVIMDVAQDTVVEQLMTYQVQRLIHGHTHRGQIHSIKLQEECENKQRIVLSDWDAQGNYLTITESNLELCYFKANKA